MAQAYETCVNAQANPVSIASYPYSETISIDPSWTNDTEYNPDGLGDDISVAYWAFTVNNEGTYYFSFSSSGIDGINENVSIGFSEGCPISSTNELFFGLLSNTGLDCQSLGNQTYVLVFAVDQGNEGELTININSAELSNDECEGATGLIPFEYMMGSNICASPGNGSGTFYPCGPNSNSNENAIWYQLDVNFNEKGFYLTIDGAGLNPMLPSSQISVSVFDFELGCDFINNSIILETCTFEGAQTFGFDCIGEGNYLIRLSTSSVDAGDFTVFFEPIELAQPNDNCDAPIPGALDPELLDLWVQTIAVTFGSCPESVNLDPANCGISTYGTVWFQITAPAEAEYLDLQINDGTFNDFISVFDFGIDCDNLSLVSGSSCYTGLFSDLESIGQSLIDIIPGDTYLIAVGSVDIGGGVMNIGAKWLGESSDCPDGSNIGDNCNDFDPCTIDDIINADCLCVGTFQDTDGDGTCDAEDVCQGGPEPGTLCDDQDACTINDLITADCICLGTFQDSDNDGTCDEEDVCEGPEPGTACDDENDCTIDDTINGDCICVGIFQDEDFDGICDAEDVCENGPEPGTLCNDGNDCTIDDVILESCLCAGTFQDSDFDGTCDAEDVCEGGPEPGTSCDDEDDCTIDDMINMDCDCIGIFQDTDNDGICDADDQCSDGPEPGSACDDNDNTTFNDQIDLDCECIGTTDPLFCPGLNLNIGDACDDGDVCTINDIVDSDCNCVGTFQDSDEDGVCDAEDMCPEGPEPGTLCDDNDNSTFNDMITIECICAGISDSIYCQEIDLYIGDVCDDLDQCTVDDIVNAGCECVGIYQDTDNDGTCDAEDVCSDGPEPGSSCDDNDENTFNDQITPDCECVGTSDPNFCAGLDLYVGDTCDDDDVCTVDDLVSADCECIGVYQDSDSDGICDAEDNCPDFANEDQLDNDQDNIGDVCDGDDDNDGIADEDDNCPLIANENQEDGDMDGIGDPCDISSTVILEYNLNLYPNPTSGILFVDLLEEVDYKILSIHGNVLKVSKSLNRTIDLTPLSNGLYIIELTINDRPIGYRKIVKL